MTEPTSAQRDAVNPATMIGRVARVLDGFLGTSYEEQRLTDIARRSGLPKATVSRIVTELVDQHFLERSGTSIRLGVRFFELGQHAVRPQELRRLAMARMINLRNKTGRTVHLAVLDGSDVIYLAVLDGPDPLPLASRVGGRLPAHATAVGKALLACAEPHVVDGLLATSPRLLGPRTIVDADAMQSELAAIRRDGVAFEREESGPGIACVAAPVHLGDGRAIAALSVSARSEHAIPLGLSHAVRTTADAVGRDAALSPVFRTC
ncbi:IclR family transcriptional regulator [Rhodococcus fascians]|nr:IclR family transcriptional regulator [Rhodococcus fascians]MBY4399030.1 IclR family transcriptional regulator [Rhodococcus fascians]MBY4408568.1 IclR family transcriptional regulator [Rhodococcus fascians]MBY4423607.1 IclR family transcriptional regulator [Rhodococcus fascians]MBY4462869.1 IclR family transcriptional regulator [Rhodococcus fascians]